jgi:hypothetical protein
MFSLLLLTPPYSIRGLLWEETPQHAELVSFRKPEPLVGTPRQRDWNAWMRGSNIASALRHNSPIQSRPLWSTACRITWLF